MLEDTANEGAEDPVALGSHEEKFASAVTASSGTWVR